MNKSLSKKDMSTFFIYFMMLFPFFKPTYFGIVSNTLDTIFQVSQLFLGFIAIILFISRKKLSKIYFYVFLYILFLIGSTIIHKGDVSGICLLSFKSISLFVIVDYFIQSNTRMFLKTFGFLLSSLVFLNFITVILYPNGMYVDSLGNISNWLLGYKNMHILYIMPAILITFLYSIYEFNKIRIRNYLFLIMSFVSIVLAGSSTGVVALAIVLFFSVNYRNLDKLKVLNIFSYYIGYIVMFLGIIILRIQNLFSKLLIDVLHRDLTFTGRTYIWDYVLGFIKKSPLIGYGVEVSSYRYNKTNYMRSYHAHNQVLEVIYQVGIIGFITYVLLIYNSFKNLWTYKNYKVVKFVGIVMLSYFVMMLTEFYTLNYYFYLLVICYQVKYFIKGSDKDGRIN